MATKKDRLTSEAWADIKFIWDSSGNLTGASERYGISRRAVYAYAKRHGWKRRAGLAGEARETVSREFVEMKIEDYRKQIEEVSTRNLETFRFLQDVALRGLREIEASVKFKAAYNDLARQQNYEMLEAGIPKKNDLKPFLDVSREISALGTFGDVFIKAIMKGERIIMGIADYRPMEEKEPNPLDRLVAVLEENIIEFNQGVSNGTTDPNTGEAANAVQGVFA